MSCPCGCGADVADHCWKESFDSQCIVCGTTPCFYVVLGEAVCSREHAAELLRMQKEAPAP